MTKLEREARMDPSVQKSLENWHEERRLGSTIAIKNNIIKDKEGIIKKQKDKILKLEVELRTIQQYDTLYWKLEKLEKRMEALG